MAQQVLALRVAPA